MSIGGKVPTRRGDFRLMVRTARLVLSVPTYAFVAVVSGTVALTAFVMTQNATLVSDTVIGGSLPVANRLTILSEIYPFVGGFYDTPSSVAMVGLAVLSGINIALVTYHFREHDLSASGSGGSAFGVVLGVLGAGCAACGSAVLFGVLSVFGAGGLVLALPFEGLEISLLAVVVLFLSTYWLSEGMRGGEVAGCPIDVTDS